MGQYMHVDDLLGPVRRVAMPRAPRLYAPGGTVHVVARCNNREFYLNSPEDFEQILSALQGVIRDYGFSLYAYTLMSNHVHPLLQAPTAHALGRPMRWFMTETAKAFHRARKRRGHFWERRYRACLVDDDVYALAALRYMDRNPVRAGIVGDPTAYPWSSCAAYARGISNLLINLHPSYLALSPYSKVRQRRYMAMLAPSDDPRLDAQNPAWTTQRAIGSPAFVARCVPPRGRPKS